MTRSSFRLRSSVRVQERTDQVLLVDVERSAWIKLTREAWSLVAGVCGAGGPTPGGAPLDGLIDYLVHNGYLVQNCCLRHSTGDNARENGERDHVQVGGVNLPFRIKRAYLNITDRCNLRCPTCYFNARYQDDKDALDIRVWHGIIEKIAEDGIPSVVIGGGEPLVRQDALEFLAKAASLFEDVVLLTNGTLITEHLARSLAGLNLRIQISLEGVEQDWHDTVRGRGSFDAVLAGIKRLVSAGASHIELVPTVTRRNLRSLAVFGDFAQSLGVGHHFSLFMPVGRGHCWSRDLEVTPRDLAVYVAHMLDRVTSLQGVSPLEACPKVSCGAGESIISLGPDGTVYPCPLLHLPHLGSGNITLEPLRNVMERMRGMLPGVDELPGCRECDVRYFCGGGCRAPSCHDRGDFMEKDPYCEFYRRLYRAFVWEWREDRTLEYNLFSARRCLLDADYSGGDGFDSAAMCPS